MANRHIACFLALLAFLAGLRAHAQPGLVTEPLARFGAGVLADTDFSPDGSLIATGGPLGVFLWDAETGKLLRTLEAPPHGRFTFSGDGSRILTWNMDDYEGPVGMWDPHTGAQMQTLADGRDLFVKCAAFGPQDALILTGNNDGTATLWDAHTGEEIQAFIGHTRPIVSVAFSHDAAMVLTDDINGYSTLWEIQTGAEMHRVRCTEDDGVPVAFSADRSMFLNGALWETETGSPMEPILDSTTDLFLTDFSPDGASVLGYYRPDGGFWPPPPYMLAAIWDTATGEKIRELEWGYNYQDHRLSAFFSHDGRRVVLTAEASVKGYEYHYGIQLFDAATTEMLHTFTGGSPVLSQDGAQLLSRIGCAVKTWDTTTGAEIHTIDAHTSPVRCVAFSPDGEEMLIANGNVATLRRVETGEVSHVFGGHPNSVTAVAFSPDGSRILTASRRRSFALDTVLILWDRSTRAPVWTWEGTDMRSVAFSPDGTKLLAGGANGVAMIVDTANEDIVSLSRHDDDVFSVAYSPNGDSVLTGSADGTARVWDVSTGENTLTLGGSPGSFFAVAFSPDGDFAVTGGDTSIVRLWDLGTGEVVREFGRDIPVPINSLAFSPGGGLILSGNDAGPARLWETQTGVELRMFFRHAGDVTSAVFSPDGTTILTGGMDGVAALWDTEGNPRVPGPPILDSAATNSARGVDLAWTNALRTAKPDAFVAMAYDLYEDDWAPIGPDGGVFHRFDASATTGSIDLEFSGAYFVWVGNEYSPAEGGVFACENPAAVIVHDATPHTPLDVKATYMGDRIARLDWRPDPYGVLAYWMIVWDPVSNQAVPALGPRGESLWHYVLHGEYPFTEGSAHFIAFTLGDYWLYIAAMGWDLETFGAFNGAPVFPVD